MAPPGNQAANGENKLHAYSTGRSHFYSTENQVNDLEFITIKQAQALGLSQLTLTQEPDTQLRVGDGATSMRYIDWLAAEQERITWDGDRQAEIVQDGKGGVSLWVDPVAV